MNLDDKKERLPFPKWRELARTPSTELVSAGRVCPDQALALLRVDRARAFYERWKATPSLDNAMELLDCACFVSNNDFFCDAALQVLNSDKVTNTSKFVAQQIIQPSLNSALPLRYIGSIENVRGAIGKNRLRLRNEARNSLLHAEQARLYAVVGEMKAAERSFRTALAISPNNRHILRSFARFMVHVDRPESALERLWQSSVIRTDPWVQAAEIAISEHVGSGSKFAKLATGRLEASELRPAHMSELASALATLELSVGNRKKFKRRIKESLLEPSDNALAQATWIFRKSPDYMHGDLANAAMQEIQASTEARTYAYLTDRNWKQAVQCFRDWQSEESFSSHIAIEGSFYAISFAKDYDAAAEICHNGLIANNLSTALLNNLCYAERRRGSIGEARKAMARLKSICGSWDSSPEYLSTDGMLNFTVSDYDMGRNRYRSALEIALRKADRRLCRKIRMHWFHEEALSNTVNELQGKRLIAKIEAEVTQNESDGEMVEYWQNLKEEIEASWLQSRKLLPGNTEAPHFLEEFAFQTDV